MSCDQVSECVSMFDARDWVLVLDDLNAKVNCVALRVYRIE